MATIKSAEKFKYEVVVREGHLDTFGHMNNATYLQVLEEARWEIIAQKGYGIEEIKQKGYGPVILEIEIKFQRELKLREKIIIETQCVAVEKKITKFKHEIWNSAGKLSCIAEFVIGVFDLTTRRLIPLPQDWVRAIGVELDESP